jgi:dTDP-4-dehydrorhamnose 3,5-epimerase
VKIEPLAVPGAWLCAPVVHADDRGLFTEWFRPDLLAQATGIEFVVAQGNLSVSQRGVVRGIHFTTVPPGQMKFVQCVAGAVLDVIVDVRAGSPTFGTWDAVPLNPQDRRAVFVEGGLGHAFCALEDQSSVVYLTSSRYDPETERTVLATDPAIGIDWPSEVGPPQLSPRDAVAPTLAEADASGLLPRWVKGSEPAAGR